MTALMPANADAVKLIMTLLIFGVVIAVNIVSAIRKSANARQRREKATPGGTGDSRPSSARRPGQQIEDFLRSLGQKPSTTRRQPERPQPKPPQTPRPEPKAPVRRPEPLVARRPREKPQKRVARTPARATARPKAATRRHASAARAAKPTKPVEGGMESVRRTVPEAKGVLVEPVDAAETLEAKLPRDVLKRAVMWREILGPCRATQPYDALRR